jgi:hypothetical protein
MRNSTLKPYRETVCVDCLELEVPDKSVKITVANRCLLAPHFHYKKSQEQRYKDKQAITAQKVKKPKEAVKKPRQTDLSKRSIPSLLLLAQNVFNTYIRFRDSKGDYFICISCNQQKLLGHMHAGHYYSAGHHSYLRFNEFNTHGQCERCNCFLHGNLTPYRENLIKKIGPVELEKLDIWKNFSHKWDKAQLIGIIQLYREKIKQSS